jgi:hypothetical protein
VIEQDDHEHLPKKVTSAPREAVIGKLCAKPDRRPSLERPRDDAALSPLTARAFDVVDQIADDIDPVDIVIRDFHIDELIFDDDHQFQTIEPIGP